MKRINLYKAVSIIEFVFIILIVGVLYIFVLKQLVADIKFFNLREDAEATFTKVQDASDLIMTENGYRNLFNNEYDVAKILSKKIHLAKVCNDAKKDGCWSNNWLWDNLRKPGFVLDGGQYIVPELSSGECKNNRPFLSTCGALYVDTNGDKKPNKIGHDIIKIYITNDGLIPAGVSKDTINPSDSCDLINKFSWSCSARLLRMQ